MNYKLRSTKLKLKLGIIERLYKIYLAASCIVIVYKTIDKG
jgi:hypothetical protein